MDDRVFNGVRKTINRFREKPFHYFTEADIHSSLANDIMCGSSDVLTYRHHNLKDISVSLVHQEYPTNFRYEKKKLLQGYLENELHQTKITSKHGDRGNFDLAILNPKFLEEQFAKCINDEYLLVLKNIINKDINLAIKRNISSIPKEIIYAFEVKYIHTFNARTKEMLNEVIRDNKKLELACITAEGNLRAINLVFCSSDVKNSKVLDDVKKYIENYDSTAILNIFIESYLAKKKKTNRPIINMNHPSWAEPLIKILGIR